MREILEKSIHKYNEPVMTISQNNVYISECAKGMLNLQKGDRIIISKNNGLLSFAIDSRLEPSKVSYSIVFKPNGAAFICRHMAYFESGHYLIPEKPTEFDGKYEWYDLEKID